MGNAQQGINKVNFDDIKKVKSNDHVLINTLNSDKIRCCNSSRSTQWNKIFLFIIGIFFKILDIVF